VVLDSDDRVRQIQVKDAHASSPWIWGAFKLTGAILRELYELWRAQPVRDEYIGSLVNAWLAQGGEAYGVRAGTSYVDVGTLRGYREAITLLSDGQAMMPSHASGAAGVADQQGSAVRRSDAPAFSRSMRNRPR